MKKITVCLLLVLFAAVASAQSSVNLDSFTKYIIDNFSLPGALKGDCHYHYAAIVLESDNKGEITEVRYVNQVHPDLKASFDFLKKFRFDASTNIKMRPILIIATIEQQDRKQCPYLYQFHLEPNSVLVNVVKIVSKQLKKNPQTILMNALRFIDPVLPASPPAAGAGKMPAMR